MYTLKGTILLRVTHIALETQFFILLLAVTSWRQNWIKKNWKTSTGAEVMNKDLFERLFRLIDNRPGEVKIVSRRLRLPCWKNCDAKCHLGIQTHVPGHSGNAGNDMADRLAVQGAQMAARLKLGS
jgi:ribonuclease HI